jgi:hypothetical protein
LQQQVFRFVPDYNPLSAVSPDSTAFRRGMPLPSGLVVYFSLLRKAVRTAEKSQKFRIFAP